MGRTLGPTCKYCRRAGMKLCNKQKCASQRRAYPPGIHGPKRQKKLSEYGLQLLEKQKAKHMYGVRETQFFNYYSAALQKTENTGVALMQTLEQRLDNVVFRMGLAPTRPAARQLVTHKFIQVNGKTVNIPSYQVQVKDVVSVNPTKKERTNVKQASDYLGQAHVPQWMTQDATNMSAKITDVPNEKDVQNIGIDTKLIVEYYSRL